MGDPLAHKHREDREFEFLRGFLRTRTDYGDLKEKMAEAESADSAEIEFSASEGMDDVIDDIMER